MYAVDSHHRRERHLYSMGLQNLFTRPAIHLCPKRPVHPPSEPLCCWYALTLLLPVTAAHACLALEAFCLCCCELLRLLVVACMIIDLLDPLPPDHSI